MEAVRSGEGKLGKAEGGIDQRVESSIGESCSFWLRFVEVSFSLLWSIGWRELRWRIRLICLYSFIFQM